MKDSPTPQKIEPETMEKLELAKEQMRIDGVSGYERSFTHQITVAVDKAELVPDLVDCIVNLVNKKAYMPSVENLLNEVGSIK